MPLSIGTISSHITKEYFDVPYPLVRTSIYGVSADITNLKSTYSLTDPSRLSFRWELSSASNPHWFSVPGNTQTIYLSAYASVEPINVRPVVLYNLREYRNSNTLLLKPYTSPADIPNLEVWLDANDSLCAPQLTTYSANTPAVSFTGSSNSGASIPHHSSLEMGTGDFTAEAWIYTTSNATTEQPIISKGHLDTVTFPQYRLGISSRKFFATVGGGISSNQVITGTSTVSTNTWHHVALMRKSGTIYLLVNGTVEAQAVQAGYVANSNPLTIGIRPSPRYGTKYFQGHISGVRIIKGQAIFSTTDRNSLASSLPPLSNTGSQTSFLAFQTSTTVQDYSNYNHPITLTNATMLPSQTINVNESTPWLDKSPNALSASQLDPVLCPILQASAINSLSGVVFDWTKGQILDLSQTISLPTNGNWTHFFVYNRKNTGQSISISNQTSGKTDTPFFQEANQYEDGSAAADKNFIKSSARNKKTTNAVTGTGPRVGAVINGAPTSTNAAMYINNNSIPYGTVSWGYTMEQSVNAIGGFYNWMGNHNGAMGEIVHTSLTLPENEVKLVNQRLMTKWGI
jgi:hypothetical protein